MTTSASVDYSNDILQPMQDADLLRYRDICAKQLPAKLCAHHFLTIQHRWKETLSRPENGYLNRNISVKCQKYFYAPRHGCADNCTFVAISGSISGENQFCIYAFTLEWPPSELMQCLRDTARINWNGGPLIEALSEELVPLIRNMVAEQQNEFVWAGSIICVWMPHEQAIAIDASAPEDVFIDALGEQHAAIINETWAYRSNMSCDFIRSMIQLNGGLGVFDKSTKNILAWILVSDHFALGCLETIQAARRRGLAKLLVRKYSQHFAIREHLDVFTFISEDNTASLRLFESIGFEKFHLVSWMKVRARLVQ